MELRETEKIMYLFLGVLNDLMMSRHFLIVNIPKSKCDIQTWVVELISLQKIIISIVFIYIAGDNW